MAWPADLNILLERISTPAEEVFKGLRVLGDYNKTNLDAQDVLLAAHEAAMKTYLRTLGLHGDVFIVNNGSDSAVGTMAAPFLSIKHALTQCTDYKNDVIFVGPAYWQPATEDWPIVVNKHQVHIIGLALPNLPAPAVHPDEDKAAFVFGSTGQYGSIQRLTIGGGNSYGGILLAGSVALPPEAGQIDGLLIKECTFGHQWFGTPLNGIQQPADSSRGGYGIRVEKCTFLGDLQGCTGKITGNAIDLLGNPTNPGVAYYDFEVLDCFFMGCAIGVNAYRSLNSRILRNIFVCDGAGTGEAITLGSNCAGCFIDGNSASDKKTQASTQNPYVDGGSNIWGINRGGSDIVWPA